MAASRADESTNNNESLSQPAHALSWASVVDELQTHIDEGLSTGEASKRLEQSGRNQLDGGEGINSGKILLRQIANAMTLVLIIAMVVSFAIRSWIEGGVIAAVIGINIVVGFVQEYKAQRTMDSLRELSSPTALAVREGQAITIASIEIVPGDIIEVKTGDTIPADIRLIEAVNFETDEALLTGESLPVRKGTGDVLTPETGPGDRNNVAFSSSTVVKGRATGVVFATGMQTQIGTIATALRKKDGKDRFARHAGKELKPHHYMEAWTLIATDAIGSFLGVNIGTPLQKKLSRLACFLFIVAVICAVVVLAANEFRDQQEVIIYAVATGLSMIPASLIVVLTITMAAGAKNMVRRHVIVRTLKSLEALGSVTDICSDKTGTLTQGKMVAKKAWIPAAGMYTVDGMKSPFDPTDGYLTHDNKEPRESETEEREEKMEDSDVHRSGDEMMEYLRVASLANLAQVYQKSDNTWNARGDPTEIAIQVFAARFDMNRRASTAGEHPPMKLLHEFPFDSDVKKMSVIYKDTAAGKVVAYTKGAVERVIASCTSYVPKTDGAAIEMTDEYRAQIQRNSDALAYHGLRVLALASREYNEPIDEGKEIDRQTVERDLVFRGLIGLYDPPRPESAASVRQCQRAGIEVHMLTGDHPSTAQAIAAQVGILPSRMGELGKNVADAMVMTASQFDDLSDAQIDALPVLPLVIARCAPSTKVRMIEALHRRRKFCGMTGDGVNDSPSLKKSDVGIAMGQSGSDVAKDASDIILTDDNFASILAAIEEGRRTFDNIQKFVLHLLAQNIAQAIILLVGLAIKDRDGISVFPIAPVEIMWIIMITSGLPDMGLGFEAAAPDIMQREPQDLKRGVFTIEIIIDMLFYGIWIAALCLGSFVLVLYGFNDGNIGIGCNESIFDGCEAVFSARATSFATLTWLSLFLAWQVIDIRRSFFRMQPDSTRYFTQWIHDVWRNKFLFFSIVAGFVTIFPILYIPVINTRVFKHNGISWEWVVVLICSLLFFMGCELWKFAKRVFFRRRQAKSSVGQPQGDLEQHTFKRYLTESSSGYD